MTSAGRLYRLLAAFGFIALGSIGVGAFLAAHAAHFVLPWGAVAQGCRGIEHGQVTAATGLVVLMLAVGCAVGARAAAALWRELRSDRALRRALHVLRRERRAGVSFRVVEDGAPQAFCVGILRPRIYVSTAALEALSAAELRGVLVHERHHRRRRDPLRLAFLRVLEHALPFLPGLPRIADRYAALAEVAADEAALAHTGDRRSLARALLMFGAHGQPAGAVGIAPERVDLLMGRPPAWGLPLAVLAAFVLAVGTLAGAVAIADLLLHGHHVDVPLPPAPRC